MPQDGTRPLAGAKVVTGRNNGGRPVLDARNLRVSFPTAAGVVQAVDGVSLTVGATETLGLIGESGCGKSVTAQALIQTLPPPGRLDMGEILLTTDAGTIDLARIDPDGEMMRDVRGRHIGMVFQDPAASLTPVLTIGAQLRETIAQHRTSNPATSPSRCCRRWACRTRASSSTSTRISCPAVLRSGR